MNAATEQKIKWLENLSSEEIAKVSIKFSGNVKEWLKANQSHFNGTPVISIFSDLCAWNNVTKSDVLSKEANNESIIDIINSHMTANNIQPQ